MTTKNIRKGISLFLASLFLLTSCTNKDELKNLPTDTLVVIQSTTEKEYDVIRDNAKESLPSTDWQTTAESTGTMEVHFIDVGQGDSTLIINGDHAMLIDAGDNTQGTKVQSYLTKQGVDELDYLILTHTDADHIGGADVIISKFDIETVFMGNYEKDNNTYRDVIQTLDNKMLKWSTPVAGETYSLGDASFTIIAPNGTYDDPNDTSIGILLEKGEKRFVFTGDAETEAETDIVNNGLNIQADVYQTGHHGSRTSSSNELLDAVNPIYAVISCEEGNSYGHPHAETLNKFRERGISVFRTDEQGSIIASTDGTKITWNCAPSESWQAGEPTESTEQPDTSSVIMDTKADFYICNTNSMKFHVASCESVSNMSDKNKMKSTDTRDELISQGYIPCKSCNP